MTDHKDQRKRPRQESC